MARTTLPDRIDVTAEKLLGGPRLFFADEALNTCSLPVARVLPKEVRLELYGYETYQRLFRTRLDLSLCKSQPHHRFETLDEF
jgi:hypothetical protein